ncbi:uncharacterized protein LOC134226880 [Armigeres subalbatus]|uniref:uncharacterized protein LOC134226880 n=1 Tax=Armigeres subalbatus TaxID=124917 RepID=UPI002ED35721
MSGTSRGKHHTLVCFQPSSNGYGNGSPSARASAVGTSFQSKGTRSPQTPTQVSSNVSNNHKSSVLLATAVVLVQGEDGVCVPTRALLDSGSECNFMTEKLARQLNVQRHHVDVKVNGIGQANIQVKGRTTVTIKSRVTDFSRRMEFLLLPKVTANLPTTNVDTTGWELPDGVRLADPSFFTSQAIDLVLGIQHFFTFYKNGDEVLLGKGLPTLTESVFGWVVSGCVDRPCNNYRIVCNTAVDMKEKRSRLPMNCSTG